MNNIKEILSIQSLLRSILSYMYNGIFINSSDFSFGLILRRYDQLPTVLFYIMINDRQPCFLFSISCLVFYKYERFFHHWDLTSQYYRYPDHRLPLDFFWPCKFPMNTWKLDNLLLPKWEQGLHHQQQHYNERRGNKNAPEFTFNIIEDGKPNRNFVPKVQHMDSTSNCKL